MYDLTLLKKLLHKQTEQQVLEQAVKFYVENALSEDTRRVLIEFHRIVSSNPEAEVPASQAGTVLKTTKKNQAIQMLTTEQGASVHELMNGLEWQRHSVRGFISILGKEYAVDVVRDQLVGCP
jgi:hypothetical protein